MEIPLLVKSAMHYMKRGSDRIYTIGEGVVQFKNSLDYELFVRHFPLIKQEMLLGMTSRYHSSKILEMKGLSVGEKAPLIHEKILNMSHHFPSFFDHGIFSLMQKYLVKVPDTYKKDHDSSDMVKTICSLYLLQKKLSDNIENAPQKRMAVIKYRFVNLQVPFGIKKVLGVTFGLTFLRKNERFSKDHLLKAVNSIMPGVTCIPSSFFSIEQEGGNASLFYLELEKSDPFTQEEKNKMQKELLRGCPSSHRASCKACVYA